MIPTELEKQTAIKAEIDKLNKVFAKIEPKTKKAVDSLIGNAAFMSVTLKLLQADINVKGVIETYQNGANQSGTKKSSEVEVYNSMIKNYSGIIKQLTDLLPKTEPEPVGDELDEHIKNKKPGR